MHSAAPPRGSKPAFVLLHTAVHLFPLQLQVQGFPSSVSHSSNVWNMKGRVVGAPEFAVSWAEEWAACSNCFQGVGILVGLGPPPVGSVLTREVNVRNELNPLTPTWCRRIGCCQKKTNTGPGENSCLAVVQPLRGAEALGSLKES